MSDFYVPRTSLFQNGGLKRLGDEGERVIEAFLRRYPGVTDVKNVTEDREWQQKDVDFLAFLGARSLKIEAKSDRHIARNKNVLFELARIHHTSPETCAYLGWSVFSAADFLLVYNPPTRCIYQFRMPDLRSGMQQFTLATRRTLTLRLVESDSTRSTLNVYIPLSYVPHRRFQPKAGGAWQCAESTWKG